MLNSFQIDVSERNSTAPFVQRERCQYTHEGHPSLWFPPVCRCVCLCVSAHSEFSLYRYFSLSLSCMELCSHTHSLTHSHTHTHTHTHTHYKYSLLSLRTFPIIALSALPSLNVKYRVSPDIHTDNLRAPFCRVCVSVGAHLCVCL